MESARTLRQDRIIYSLLFKHLVYIGIIILGIVIGLKEYLIFHTAVELFSSIIAFMIFIIAINTYNTSLDNKIIFLGYAFGFIALFDILHMFSYKGMGFLGSPDGNLPTQLWIIARYMQSISFLISVSPYPIKLNSKRTLIGYCIVSVFALLSIYLKVFPDCFIDGQGLTKFKIYSEFIICGILAFTIYLRLKSPKTELTQTTRLVVKGLIITIASELFFTLYTTVYDIYNIIGHILKLISFYFIYFSFVKASIKEPYDSLVQLNNLVTKKNRELEVAVSKIKAEYELAKKRKIESQQKSHILNTILEGTINGVLTIGHDRRIIHYNNNFIRILELPDTINYETTIEEIIHYLKQNIVNEEEFINNLKVICNSNGIFIQTLNLKSGKVIEASSLPFIDGGVNKGILTIFYNMTDKIRVVELEENIQVKQAAIEKAKEYDAMKDIFLSTVSHELRTPLTIILGTIQLMDNVHESINCPSYPQITNYIKIMKQNCYRLIKISNNLIDINKMDSGFFAMELKNHDIVNVVEDITFSVADYIKSKGITLIFDTDAEEKLMAFDSYLLERVMLNLLSNAVKFTDKGGKIEVEILDKQDTVIIVVRDNGPGIPAEKVNIIFDRFSQVDTSLKRRSEGSGIGLALVKLIVEQHRGNIYLNEEVETGTEFVIELPVFLVEECNSFVFETKMSNVERIDIEFSDIYDIK